MSTEAQRQDLILVQRVYDPMKHEPGVTAFLVDRLWPRGLRKKTLNADWLRDVGPSDELRHWFGHKPERWTEFKRNYLAELKKNPEAWKPLQDAMRKGTICLLFASKDAEHNNAVVLKEFLERACR